MMRHFMMKKGLLGIVMVLGFFLFGCGDAGEIDKNSGQKEKKKTFIFAAAGAPTTFSPPYGGDGFSLTAGSCVVFNRLVEFKLGRTNVIPGLAEKWEVSDNGRVYRFHLRRNVPFHHYKEFKPTRDFNADDVMFSILRQFDKSHYFHNVGDGQYKYFKAQGFDQLIQDIVKIDDYTVEIRLSQPDATFLATCAMPFMSIMSKEFADYQMNKGTAELFDQIPVGTGPFSFENYVKDQTIRYASNKDYWAGAPKIDHLIFSITPDEQVRTQKILSGLVHAIEKPSVENLEEFRNSSSLRLLEQLGQNTGYLALNTSKKPFDDVRIREALDMAINKKAIIDTLFKGNAFEAVNLLPPVIWAHHDGIKPRGQQLEKAKALLKEAGYDENNPLEFTLMAMDKARPYNPNAKKMAEMVQYDLSQIGVKVHVKVMEWGQYINFVLAGKHEAAFWGWSSDNADPDNFLNVLLGCDSLDTLNVARWCHPEADEIMKHAKQITDQPKRKELYKKVQEIMYKDVAIIPLAHAKVFVVTTDNVKNFIIDLFGLNFFHTIDIE